MKLKAMTYTLLLSLPLAWAEPQEGTQVQSTTLDVISHADEIIEEIINDPGLDLLSDTQKAALEKVVMPLSIYLKAKDVEAHAAKWEKEMGRGLADIYRLFSTLPAAAGIILESKIYAAVLASTGSASVATEISVAAGFLIDHAHSSLDEYLFNLLKNKEPVDGLQAGLDQLVEWNRDAINAILQEKNQEKWKELEAIKDWLSSGGEGEGLQCGGDNDTAQTTHGGISLPSSQDQGQGSHTFSTVLPPFR